MNKAVQTIKLLALEAIASANSGHGGIALGAANTIYALFHDHLNFDIKNNDYFNRDRFILSSGHGSALLYATMCVFGFNGINVDDLKSFRKFDSKTPGHPESLITLGIEFSTGPLGQGTSSSVGFAICEQHLANLISPKVINHYTYVMMGDGDLEEGVTQEAIIIAGKLKLNKLIWLYDSNDVQLDGNVQDSTN
jgi:transketolase